MILATRRLQYAIGHRVYKHESKCAKLHGHNFVFHLTAEAPELDSIGRVIDFGVLKEKFGTWLETNLDHGMVLWDQDEEAIAGVRYIPGSKLFLLPWNPTAENLARYLLEVVGPQVLAGTNVRLIRVKVDETENGSATAELADA
jgi:6-pyruvoyltetrahydropterin/6-carboxytetrahydropterin synthase